MDTNKQTDMIKKAKKKWYPCKEYMGEDSSGWEYRWSDIEVMGLGKTYIKTVSVDNTVAHVKLIHYSDEAHTINIYVKLEDREYHDTSGDRLFNGKCPSKNELVTIMKLLNIK